MPDETLPQIEERILRFWKDRGIFEQSLKIRRKGRPFRFFEGPPTANAGPGIHHVLSRIFKDIVCRYKTMRGFYVERKAGWDTHGLPVELQIEKELGIKHKAEIEKFGIAEFNKKAKASVWRYKEEWEKFTERIGFWIDLARPYITYDSAYMESLWWIIQQLWKKGLFEEDYKVVPYCPRCETPLSSHEVAQGYETVKDPSVYIKLKIENRKSKTGNEYLLVWTTTPWTLPANVAVAVNPSLTYTKYKIGDGYYWSATPPPFEHADDAEAIEKEAGKSLVGLEYEPIFRQAIKGRKSKLAYRVTAGDFVSAEEGTGLVHIAPAFGEEDMELAKKYGLPIVRNVAGDGRFSFSPDELAREPFFNTIQGQFVKDADKLILKELQKRGVLYRGDLEGITHEYPFCWRCNTPLLYYSHKSWFVRMSRLREQLLANNAKINWIPAHIKEGRFGEWLREVKDWAFSRERYWGTPLPIWRCGTCGRHEAIGSLEELNKKAYKPNTFFVIRHGEADHIVKNYIAGWPEAASRVSHLTEKGKREIAAAGRILAKKKIDLIVSSDLVRMKEVVTILKKYLPKAKVTYDPRLRELNTGMFNYQPIPAYHRFFKKKIERFSIAPAGGETLTEAQMRYFSVWRDLNRTHRDTRILIVGHGDPLWVLEGKLKGLTPEEILKAEYIEPGEWRRLPQNDLPYNDDGEIDLHRPYVDALRLACTKCGSPMQRVKEVADVWFDSGAMPFAQWHYPFENRERITKGISFPADYIAEAVDQTRGWFYTLLAVSTALGYRVPSYKNVICLGHILDEQGEKMSKSKGNVVNPWEMLARYGADSLRWYFYTVNPPGEPKKFSERDLARNHQELLVLLNVVRFFTTYAPRKIAKGALQRAAHPLDLWIRARLSELLKDATAALERYEIGQAARHIAAFIDDLSRWYVRRSRRRFQRPRSANARVAASAVLGAVLRDLAAILAPFTPFLAEHIWREVTPRLSDRHAESVHLAQWPSPKSIASANSIMTKMRAVRALAALGLQLRQTSRIKVRQPLRTFSVHVMRDSVRLDDALTEILAEELNVKKVQFVRQLPEGPHIIKGEAGEWRAALDIEITPELKAEGELRELIRNIQELRQALMLNPKDAIALHLASSPHVEKELRRNASVLQREVGATRITFGKPAKFDAIKEYRRDDGAEVTIAVKKLP